MTVYRSLLLERSHAIEVLLRLRENHKLSMMELLFMIGDNRALVRRRVDELAGVGLIRIEVINDPVPGTMLTLTLLGLDVADHLAEIEHTLRR